MTKETCKYFFSANAALLQAKKQVRIETSNPNVDALQICYYNGEELLNAPKNCIHVDINNFFNYFLMTKNRLPKQIDFSEMDFSQEVKAQLIEALTASLQQVQIERNTMLKTTIDEIKKYKPDFSNKHRIFLMASRETTVMQYASKNVASAFRELGYECYLSIEENDMQELAPFIHLINFLAFKPTITFNINHLNNEHLAPELFNIVWFQDSMPIVLNDQPIKLRERDYIYALIIGIQNALKTKGVTSTLQSFFIDHHIYKEYPAIKRNHKVVFIGSSYLNQLPVNTPMDLIEEMTQHYLNNGQFNTKYLTALSKKYPLSYENIFQSVLPYIIRDVTLLELSKMSIEYELEIYGWGWQKYDQLRPFYKGALTQGEEISKVYNSAEYALVTHPNYIIQQRTLEATASKSTALVYDARYRPEVNAPFYEDELHFFQNLTELHTLLNSPYQPKEAKKLLAEHNSVDFVRSIIERIDTVLE